MKRIKIGKKFVEYTVKLSAKSKGISLKVKEGKLIVVKSKYLPNYLISFFIIKHQKWIKKHLENNFKKSYNYRDYRDEARETISQRVEELSLLHNFKYNRLSIRNQSTRWGSCSSLANLNFNFRLIFLSDKLRDYVIIHELCHLQEPNHSKKFWSLVSKYISNYLELRRELKKIKII